MLLRSVLFYVGYIGSTAVWGTWSAITGWLLPRRWRHRYIIWPWSKFVIWWLRVTCGIFARVTGSEHLQRSPCLLFVKHQSTFDALFIQTLVSPQATVIKRALLWIPAFGWAFLPTGPIAINRAKPSTALRRIIDLGRKNLSSGYWVTIFPEGARVQPGSVGTLQPGGAMLAARTGVPIIVVAINAGHRWPVNQLLKHPGPIDVVISAPMETRGKKASEINAMAGGWLRSVMREIDPPA